MDNAENQPRTQQDAHEHTWREEQAHYLSRQAMIGHSGIAMETQHLCPASLSRGGLSGLAGVPPGIRPARCPRGGVPPAVERQLHLLTGFSLRIQQRVGKHTLHACGLSFASHGP